MGWFDWLVPTAPSAVPAVTVFDAPAPASDTSDVDDGTPASAQHFRRISMSSLDQSIQDLLSIEGATGAAIVDLGSGMALASGGNPGFSLDVAAAGNANVIRAKLRTMSDLEVSDEIDDILITLGRQYHLVNVTNDDTTKGLFVYLVLNRSTANLALARHKLKLVANSMTI